MKYITSYYRYVMTFSSIGKSFPTKDAEGSMRNVVEITDQEYGILMRREPIFRNLVERRKYRVTDYMPESAKPDSARINEAKKEPKAAKAENASLADENEKLKARIAELERQAAANAAPKEPVVKADAEPAKKPAKKPASKKK